MKVKKFVLEMRCEILKKCAVYCRTKNVQYISQIQTISNDLHCCSLDLTSQKLATKLLAKYSARSYTYSKWYDKFNKKYQNSLKSLKHYSV